MNTNNNNTSEAIAVAAAKTLKRFAKVKAKDKRERKGYYPVALTLLATQKQIDADPRLLVVRDFLKASAPGKGKKCSPRRQFLIQALYDGIVSAAEQDKHVNKDDTHILS